MRQVRKREGGGRRKAAKVTAPVPVVIETSSTPRPTSVGLLDVSFDSACLYGEALPEVGTELIFRCGRIEAFGTVAWAACDQIGIHFHGRLSRSDLGRLRYEGDLTRLARMTVDGHMAADARQSGTAR